MGCSPGIAPVRRMGPEAPPGPLDVYERALLARALRETYVRQWQDADGVRGGIMPNDAASHRNAAPSSATAPVLAGTEGEHRRAAGASTGASRWGRRVRRATNVALDRPFVVFQIRDLPKELWPLAIHQISSTSGTPPVAIAVPRRLIVDESAALLAHPSGGAFLAEVARRARKYYLGLVTITQKVADLADSEHGETILTNAAMKLLLKQNAGDRRCRRQTLSLYRRRTAVAAGCRQGRWPATGRQPAASNPHPGQLG